MLSRFAGLFAIAPTAIFLVISFFVLLSANKAEAKGLKVFGYCIAVLLWISAALFFSTGILGNCPMMKCMKPAAMGGMIHQGMQGGPGMMHQGMQATMPEKK